MQLEGYCDVYLQFSFFQTHTTSVLFMVFLVFTFFPLCCFIWFAQTVSTCECSSAFADIESKWKCLSTYHV